MDFRKQVLESFGATGSEIDELLEYNTNVFDHSAITAGLALPLADEPFVPFWQEYAEDAKNRGVFEVLKQHLVQLEFPIQEGMSDTEAYKQAMKKGIVSDAIRQSQGLELKNPTALHLFVHQTLAGKIPIIVAYEKDDFVSLLRALTLKNEPKPVPDSQGATMIAGYNNWDRIWKLKEQMIQEKGEFYVTTFWAQEFKNIIPQRELYQDKFILLSRDYYSDVTPEQVGLDEEEWREKSLIIRREHECTHYFTKRVLSSMRNNILDELIADYAGITAAIGKFRSDWFLTFVGLENYPHYREGGRLQNYRGTPPLSAGAFTILQKLVYHAAQNLKQYEITGAPEEYDRQNMVLALTYTTIEELVSEKSSEIIQHYRTTCLNSG